jgi:hypothetical protein
MRGPARSFAGVGQTTLPVPTDRFDVLLDVARPCLRRAWIPREQTGHHYQVMTRSNRVPVLIEDRI